MTIDQLIKRLEEQKRLYGGDTEVSVFYNGDSNNPDWCKINNVLGTKGDENEMTDDYVTIFVIDEN